MGTPLVAHLRTGGAVNIGMHTASVVHVIELRSSWEIVDGFAYPASSESSARALGSRRVDPVRARIARHVRGMDESRAEIAKRIRERGGRVYTCATCGTIGHSRRTCGQTDEQRREKRDGK